MVKISPIQYPLAQIGRKLNNRFLRGKIHMKKRSRWFAATLAAGCLLQTGQAFAGTLTFGNDAIAFPDATKDFSDCGNDNAPDVTSMTVYRDEATGKLTQIIVNADATADATTSAFNCNDLSANPTGVWKDWHYLTHSGGDRDISAGAVVHGSYTPDNTYISAYTREITRTDHESDSDADDPLLKPSNVSESSKEQNDTADTVANNSASSLGIKVEADAVKGWSQEWSNDILVSTVAPKRTMDKPVKTIFFIGVPVAVILLVGGIASLLGRSNRA